MTEITRRRILELAAAGQVAAIAEAQNHAHAAAKSGGRHKFEWFSLNESAEVEALAGVILPSTSGPGAREAGVVHFIDRALATFDHDKREAYRAGLRMVQARREELFPGSKTVAGLKAAEQIRLAESIEKTEFFEMLRTHTVMGFLGSPTYGGNRNEAGWTLIGFQG